MYESEQRKRVGKCELKISLVHAKWIIQKRGDEKSAGMYCMSKNAINNREYKGQWILWRMYMSERGCEWGQ